MDPDSERVLRELLHSQSEWNVVGYVNPRVDELIEKIKTEMVTYARDAYLEQAWKIVTDDIVYLPTRHVSRSLPCARIWRSRPTHGTCRASASRGSRRSAVRHPPLAMLALVGCS
jgi:ABC-type oligopeptide transport system substrate-binding subunit